ncbi:MAG: VOC family protein [Maricaulaceae bacterium]
MAVKGFALKLSVNNLATALDFYQALGAEPVGSGAGYALLRLGPSLVALYEQGFQGEILSLAVDDLAATEAAVTDAFGPPVSHGEMRDGRGYFIASDPNGRVVVVEQAAGD